MFNLYASNGLPCTHIRQINGRLKKGFYTSCTKRSKQRWPAINNILRAYNHHRRHRCRSYRHEHVNLPVKLVSHPSCEWSKWLQHNGIEIYRYDMFAFALSWWKVELYHSHSKSFEWIPWLCECVPSSTRIKPFSYSHPKFNTQNFQRYSILTNWVCGCGCRCNSQKCVFRLAGKSRTQNLIHTFWLFFKCKSHGNFIRLDPSIIINIIQDVLCQLRGKKVFCANVFIENLLIKWYHVTHRAQTNITVMTNILPHNDQRGQERQQNSAAISFYSFIRQHSTTNQTSHWRAY